MYLTKETEAKYILAYFAVISGLTVFFYWSDKRKAQNGEWRTRERTLHLFELAGGWHAAFLAQRKLKHKISKKEYQFTFWTIAAIHNYVAFEYTNQWNYTKQAFEFINS